VASQSSPYLDQGCLPVCDSAAGAHQWLWENWQDPESGEWFRTCTIITGEPNELVAQIHPRMPVIIPERHHAAWIGETNNGNLKALLIPYPADQMRMWEISPRVNSPKNDDPLLLEPFTVFGYRPIAGKSNYSLRPSSRT
jgi:putative SOS response-associated peptidase YedK